MKASGHAKFTLSCIIRCLPDYATQNTVMYGNCPRQPTCPATLPILKHKKRSPFCTLSSARKCGSHASGAKPPSCHTANVLSNLYHALVAAVLLQILLGIKGGLHLPARFLQSSGKVKIMCHMMHPFYKHPGLEHIIFSAPLNGLYSLASCIALNCYRLIG